MPTCWLSSPRLRLGFSGNNERSIEPSRANDNDCPVMMAMDFMATSCK